MWPLRRAAARQPVPQRRVLFVCMGNICRSPTAEGVLRAKLESAGLSRVVEVDSAGTLGHHIGEPPDPRAQKHALARGYDLRSLRARLVAAEDFERFDLILAMDGDNLARLQAIAPPGGGRARVELLLEHGGVPGASGEVPDPYFGPPGGFDRVLDLVEAACDGVVRRLSVELGTSSAKLDQNSGSRL